MIGQITIRCSSFLDCQLGYLLPRHKLILDFQPQNCLWLIYFQSRTILGLLEGKLDPAEKGFAVRGLTGGGCEAEGDVATPRKLDGVGYIGGHGVICIAIAKFWLEAREESFLAAIPCDVNFYSSDLSAI